MLLLATLLLPAGKTEAYAGYDQLWSTTMHQGFSHSGTVRFYSPNICIHYRLDGVLNYTAHIKRWYESNMDVWLFKRYMDHVSISTPSLTIDGYRPSGSTCTTTRKSWSQATLKLRSRGYSCSFNPSISVSVPWGISAQAWPSCGSVNLAQYKTTLTQTAYHHKMLRSYDVIHFSGQAQPNETAVTRDAHWSCYATSSRIGITITGVGDDERPTGRAPACPGWDGGWGIFGGVTPVRVP